MIDAKTIERYFDLHIVDWNYPVLHKQMVDWVKNWFEENGPNSPAVIGISGGKDSTICAAILAEALGPERVIGVQMPNGEQSDIADSDRVFEITGIRKVTVNIESAYRDLTGCICENFMDDVAKGKMPDAIPELYSTNTPARMRMVTLYGIAALVGGRVVNTCNASEDYIGYSTKWGDSVGDFSLLCNLTVTDVRKLGRELGLPQTLVCKAPGDGMCGKTDEDNLGFTYDFLDAVIMGQISAGNKIFEDYPELKTAYDKIIAMHNNPNTAAKLVFDDKNAFVPL